MNKGEILGLADRDRRTLSDPQRLLWRDDVEGICPTPDLCWEYGDIARCGPCAIKQAEKFGIESNHALPNLPDVYRLRRANTQAADEIARLREEVASLQQRGAQAVIAYHVAICSPKGVVPVDSLYDPAIAARIEQGKDRAPTPTPSKESRCE